MKVVKWLCVAIILALFVGEIVARYSLGLGDPPISIGDKDVDYLFAPNQQCRRFGNTIIYNNVSMRTAVDVHRECERPRIFVCGDSIINGGVLTSHEHLATSLLQNKVGGKFVVCNVSAGSWGPGNILAYFRKFKFNTTNDYLVVEVNSHDLWEDDPKKSSGKGVGHDIYLPDHKPFCALWEGLTRYLIPRIRRKMQVATINNKVDVAKWGVAAEEPDAIYNLSVMEQIYALPFKHKCLLIHRSRLETESGVPTVGEAAFVKQAQAMGIPVKILFLDSKTDYRDGIHMNVAGQAKLCAELEGILSGWKL